MEKRRILILPKLLEHFPAAYANIGKHIKSPIFYIPAASSSQLARKCESINTNPIRRDGHVRYIEGFIQSKDTKMLTELMQFFFSFPGSSQVISKRNPIGKFTQSFHEDVMFGKVFSDETCLVEKRKNSFPQKSQI